MKTNIKKILALLLAAATFLSAAACSKAPEGEKGKENEAVINSGNAEAGADAEAVRAEIKQKAADIIATLEVGKTYDELPITAKKLGVEKFSCVIEVSEPEPSSQIVYADLTKQAVGVEAEDGGYNVGLWYQGVNDELKAYYQFGKTFVPHMDVSGYGLDITEICASTGYGTYVAYDEEKPVLKFTYMGTEELENFGETLVFEAKHENVTNRYNIDPATGFWVRYEQVAPDDTLLYVVRDIVIEPDFSVPDFENSIIDYSSFKGFATVEEALAGWKKAVAAKDFDAIAAMIPKSEEAVGEFMVEVLGMPPEHMLSLGTVQKSSLIASWLEDASALTEDFELKLKKEETRETSNAAIEEIIDRQYVIDFADEDFEFTLTFVKEKNGSWSVFTM